MAKIQLPNYPLTKNFITYTAKPNDKSSKIQRSRKDGCICNDQTLDVYSDQIKRTKYWELIKEGVTPGSTRKGLT